MTFYNFDSSEGGFHIAMESPEGWFEWGICSVCVRSDVKGNYFVCLTDFFSSLGFQREDGIKYESLRTYVPPQGSDVTLFRKSISKDTELFFVITRQRDLSSPDLSVRLHSPKDVGVFKKRILLFRYGKSA